MALARHTTMSSIDSGSTKLSRGSEVAMTFGSTGASMAGKTYQPGLISVNIRLRYHLHPVDQMFL